MSHALVEEYIEKNEKVAEYLSARDAFQKLNRIVDELAAKINNVGYTLKNWRGMFLFSDCEINLPTKNLKDLQDKSFSAANWPSPKQINEILVLWHTARNRQKDLWREIPSEYRKGLDLPF